MNIEKGDLNMVDESQPSFCKNCGEPVKNKQNKFCKKCGTKIEKDGKENQENPIENTEKKNKNSIKENKGLILIIFGILLSMTLYLIFFGIPLIIIGVYYLNKKVNEKEREVDKKLQEKRNQLDNIDATLEEMKEEQQKEINILLGDKRNELKNIDSTLEKMEQDKQKEINNKLEEKQNQLSTMDNELKKKRKELIFVEDELEMQEIGLYEPRYKFLTAVAYKEKLDQIRNKQKDSVKNKIAATCEIEWEVNGDKRKGKAMTNSNIKQIVRNFNLECDMAINKVKLSNREASIKKINKAFETLNKLNERNHITIKEDYLNLKLQELDIAIEYELKKQEEKDILREERERQKEERKIQRQLDAQEKKINEQEKALEIEISEIKEELKNKSDKEKEELEEKVKKLELALAKKNIEKEQIVDKRKRTGAGYVYILSNIGSFGENIYKIGVTRRDDPYGRVTELSDASVPFRFDHHVFIFSEEAFELEKELHNRFDHKRINKVNRRKEFFNITIDDVKKIVEENKDIVHSYSEKPEAQEYYDTLKLEKANPKLL